MSESLQSNRSHSVPLPSPVEIMVFRSSSYLFAAPLHHVGEILTPMALTTIPHSAPSVLGMGYRGRFIFPVIDFCALLTGSKPSQPTQSTVYLLFKTPSGWTAVLVDALVKIQSMALNVSFRAESGHGFESSMRIGQLDFGAALMDVTSMDGSPLPVLDLPSLLQQSLWAQKGSA